MLIGEYQANCMCWRMLSLQKEIFFSSDIISARFVVDDVAFKCVYLV